MRLLLLACVLAAGSACIRVQLKAGTSREFDPKELSGPGWIALDNTPLVLQQEETDCGAAALAMVLLRWQINTTPEMVAAACQRLPNGEITAGALRDHAKAHGLSSYVIPGNFEDLKRELSKGRPVIVGLVKILPDRVFTHFEVVAGFHPEHGRIATLDPARGWRTNDIQGFLGEWQWAGLCTIVAFPSEKK